MDTGKYEPAHDLGREGMNMTLRESVTRNSPFSRTYPSRQKKYASR
jgi:hypothetical protein